MEIWTLMRSLHLLALAFFVGGQLMLVAAVVPVLRREPPETMLAVARRFGIGSLIALGVLLATGAAMATHLSRWGDPVLHIKLAVLALAGVLMALHIVAPRSRVLSAALLLSSLLIVWLGVSLSH